MASNVHFMPCFLQEIPPLTAPSWQHGGSYHPKTSLHTAGAAGSWCEGRGLGGEKP